MKMDKEMPNNEREDTNENMSDWELLTRFAQGGGGGGLVVVRDLQIL